MTAHVKKLSGWTTVLLLVLLVAGCALPSTNGVTQVSTIDALLAGVYDGHMPLQALRQYGNFGLGTFEHLDGEMLLVDGTFYKVKFDGSVQVPPGTEGTPFAAVTYFVPDQTTAVQTPVDMAGLEAQIDQILAQPNRIGAFRVQGSFRRMVTRSVPAQTKPYPPLAEVTKLQAVFNFENVEGTLIGYRLPEFVGGVNVPGYHMHFLTADRTAGGHVLEFELEAGTLQLDTVHDWLHIYLPTASESFGAADLSQDRAQELESVEKGPATGGK